MTSLTPPAAGRDRLCGPKGIRPVCGMLVGAVLLLCGTVPAHVLAATPSEDRAAATPPAVESAALLPAARWQLDGQSIVVELAVDPSVGASHFPALAHYAIGIAGMPVMLVQPQIAVALPFYLLLAAPWQAAFNARADALARILVAEPLPEAVLRALRAQWRVPPQPTPPAPALHATLRLAGYGLMARSGRKLEAFDNAEDLCLVTDGRLEVSREGSAPRVEDISIGPLSSTRDAPPPLCAPPSRWVADDGRLLRQATREMAELLAAFIVDRVERPQ